MAAFCAAAATLLAPSVGAQEPFDPVEIEAEVDAHASVSPSDPALARWSIHWSLGTFPGVATCGGWNESLEGFPGKTPGGPTICTG